MVSQFIPGIGRVDSISNDVAAQAVKIINSAGDDVFGAGDTVSISVKGSITTVRIAYTVEATPDYSANDALGGKITLTDIVPETSAGLYLASLSVTQVDDITPELRFGFFDADLSGGTYTENGALALSSADKANFLGSVLVKSGLKTDATPGDWMVYGDMTAATVSGQGIALMPDATKTLYMFCVAGGTINFATTSSMQVVLGCIQA